MINRSLAYHVILKLAFINTAAFLLLTTTCWLAQQCSLDTLDIIPRSAWGAVEPDMNAPGEHGIYDRDINPEGWLVYSGPLPQVLTTIIVHHSALPLSDGPLGIQQKHRQQKGFADIGYHFVIDEVGQIYEGRSITTRGAHTGGHNTGTIGIVLLGNFEESDPTTEQLTSLKALIACLSTEYEITHLAGHRDFQPDETVCPGEKLAGLLPKLAGDFQAK